MGQQPSQIDGADEAAEYSRTSSSESRSAPAAAVPLPPHGNADTSSSSRTRRHTAGHADAQQNHGANMAFLQRFSPPQFGMQTGSQRRSTHTAGSSGGSASSWHGAGGTPPGTAATTASPHSLTDRVMALMKARGTGGAVGGTGIVTGQGTAPELDTPELVPPMPSSLTHPASGSQASYPPVVTPGGVMDDAVPIVLSWNHGGQEVYVAGTFDGWKTRIALARDVGHTSTFSTMLRVPPGRHQFKFQVDGTWRFDPDQPTVSDVNGEMLNTIDVSLEPDLLDSDSDDLHEHAGGDVDVDTDSEDDDADNYGTTYDQRIPTEEEFTNDVPLQLPPHFGDVLLNSKVNVVDPYVLPQPSWNVIVNHVFIFQKSKARAAAARQAAVAAAAAAGHSATGGRLTAQDSSVTVMGITQRYKSKYITTVYYKPAPKLQPATVGQTLTSPATGRLGVSTPLSVTPSPAPLASASAAGQEQPQGSAASVQQRGLANGPPSMTLQA